MQMTLDISAEQAARLDELSVRRHASPNELVVEALDTYLRNAVSFKALPGIVPSPITDAEERKQHLHKFFGALPNIGDGMAFQDRVRNEWVREWDPEYDPKIHG